MPSFLGVHALKQRGDGTLIADFIFKHHCVSINFDSAMALKALDQRLATSSNAPNSAPRPPPPTNRADVPVTQSVSESTPQLDQRRDSSESTNSAGDLGKGKARDDTLR